MKKRNLFLIAFLFAVVTGCSDHGHDHDENKSKPVKHDTLKYNMHRVYTFQLCIQTKKISI